MRKKDEKTNKKMNNEKRDVPNTEGVEKHQHLKWSQQSITTTKKQVAQASVVHPTSTEASEPEVRMYCKITLFEIVCTWHIIFVEYLGCDHSWSTK